MPWALGRCMWLQVHKVRGALEFVVVGVMMEAGAPLPNPGLQQALVQAPREKKAKKPVSAEGKGVCVCVKSAMEVMHNRRRQGVRRLRRRKASLHFGMHIQGYACI